MLQGAKPRFADETQELLRKRLFAAAVAIGAILGYAFIGNLRLGNTEYWFVRLSLLTTMLASIWLLRSRGTASENRLSLFAIRWLELIVFGVFYFQLILMMTTRLASYAEANDMGSVGAVQFGYLGAFCVLILAYGIFVPNSWRRGTAVILPMAILPYVVLNVISRWNPIVDTAFESIAYTGPIPLTLMAAAVAIYGTHTINDVRKQAFRARQFGQYRLGQLLGSGGMGQVFNAEHMLLKRPCAIKVIRPDSEADSKAIENFEREVKATAKLTHWNTVEIFDYGRTDDDTFFYVMELLNGKSLQEIVSQSGPLESRRAVYLLRQLCDALDEAHHMGLIHRDLKPANLFVSKLGRQFDILKLLDFGLVKEIRHEDQAENEASQLSGTPQFMSPEQAMSYDSVDGRSDIYSLGCVAFYAVTGRAPFVRTSIIETLMAHANDEVERPSLFNKLVDPDFETVIMKCLNKDPSDRFEKIADLAKALDGCALESPWTNQLAETWWTEKSSAVLSTDAVDNLEMTETMVGNPSPNVTD